MTLRACPRHLGEGEIDDTKWCNRGHCGDGGVVIDGGAFDTRLGDNLDVSAVREAMARALEAVRDRQRAGHFIWTAGVAAAAIPIPQLEAWLALLVPTLEPAVVTAGLDTSMRAAMVLEAMLHVRAGDVAISRMMLDLWIAMLVGDGPATTGEAGIALQLDGDPPPSYVPMDRLSEIIDALDGIAQCAGMENVADKVREVAGLVAEAFVEVRK